MVAKLIFFPIGFDLDSGDRTPGAEVFQKIIMFLQITFFQQKFFYMGNISGNFGVFILCPGKERRIVGDMYADAGFFTNFDRPVYGDVLSDDFR